MYASVRSGKTLYTIGISAQLPTLGTSLSQPQRHTAADHRQVHIASAKVRRDVALVYWNNGTQTGATSGGEAEGGYGSGAATWMRPYSMTSPGAFHAMMFRRHMEQYGTTSKQLGAISVAFQKHALRNPNAVMKRPITIEDHQASRFIAEPLHLLDYCVINDGGVALILTRADRARDLQKPPAYVLGFSEATQLDDSNRARGGPLG